VIQIPYVRRLDTIEKEDTKSIEGFAKRLLANSKQNSNCTSDSPFMFDDDVTLLYIYHMKTKQINLILSQRKMILLQGTLRTTSEQNCCCLIERK